MAPSDEGSERQHVPTGPELAERIASGLGASRYRDYDLAPYAVVVRASMPVDLWSDVFFSWLSLKGHIQGFHAAERTQAFATTVDGRVEALFVTVWDEADVLEEWLADGSPIFGVLVDMGVDPDEIDVTLMRDYS